MAARIAVDVGCTTVVAGAGEDGAGVQLLAFEGEDGPPGVMAASLVLRVDGSARAGGEADRALDADPHLGVRGPLAYLESGSAVLELVRGPVPVVALVAELLARPLRALGRSSGDAPAAAVLTTPSAWAPEGRRARALRAAAALAGLPPVTLVPAAVAAAELAREAASETLLVCDVGGRTAQLSIVELEPAGARLLATTELALGTDTFDELLYVEAVRLLDEQDPVAAGRLEELHMLTAVAGAAPDAREWAACQAELARAVRQCREALADMPSWRLEIGPPVRHAFDIGRDRLAALLETELQQVAAAARAQVDQLRAAPGARLAEPLRAVLVGGGAPAPGLRESLADELGVPVALQDDPVTAVARGALVATARVAQAPARAAPARHGPVREPASRHSARTVLDDVAAAVVEGEQIVAVVRHDAHQRVVRLDARGRVGAAHGLGGSDVVALAATPAAVVAAGSAGAAVFAAADLRPLATFERPLLAAAGGTSAWIVVAGDEHGAVLRLRTLAVTGREVRTAADERLGLAHADGGRGLLRAGPRASRAAPPGARWTVDG